MESLTNAEIIARILGPLYVVVAAGIFLNPESYTGMIKEFLDSPALLYMGGLTALIFGLLILTFHYKWDGALNAIVSLIGWLGVIKGVSLLVFPKPLISLSESLLGEPSRLRVQAVFILILGGYVSLEGYGLI